jgi:hypothetical protein
MSDIVRIVVVLVILGLIAWLVNAFIPLPYPFPTIIIVVLVIAGIAYAYKGLGGPKL